MAFNNLLLVFIVLGIATLSCTSIATANANTLNENSNIGASSVITKNVPKKTLALTRSKQIEIKNYKRK